VTFSYIMLLSWVSFSRSFVSNPNIAHYLDWLIHSFVIYAALTKTFKDKNTCMLPWQYHNFKDIWKEEWHNIMSWQQPYDCEVELQEEVQPPYGPIYEVTSMKSFKELTTFKNHLHAHQCFLKKIYGFLCMCVDYHGVNKITIYLF
jgi:hypothetical protein